MTESDWDNSADPLRMLGYLFPMRGFHSTLEMPRRLRLYYAACARRRYDRLDAFQRGLLDAAEFLADGVSTAEMRQKLFEMGESNTLSPGGENALRALGELLDRDPEGWPAGKCLVRLDERLHLGWLLFQSLHDMVPAHSQIHPSLHSADSLREVFENPLRRVAWMEDWRTADSVGIARRMYGANRFDAMGELADALEEAGCQDTAVLLHCREEYAEHHRGCWVVDGLLNRSQ